MKMPAKKVLSMTLWMARGTATMLGLAVMLAVVFGAGTAALAAVPGDPFKLGKINTIGKITQLVGSADSAVLKIDNDSKGANATALDLQVDPRKPPMRVDSFTRVEKLNADLLDGRDANQFVTLGGKAFDSDHLDGKDSTAFASGTGGKADDADKLDGKDRTEIGVNGLQQAVNTGVKDSDSPKSIVVSCPIGKVVVGTGFDILDGKSGTFPNEQTDVVVDNVEPLTPVPPLPTQVFVLAYEETPTAASWGVKAIAICAQRP